MQLWGNAHIIKDMAEGRRVFTDAPQNSTCGCKNLGKHGSRKRAVRRARYLDPRTSRWLSADPALGEYIPLAPVNDEAKKHNQNLPGMGGIYNTVNFHLYHYAGNNPVKYIDPDGNEILIFVIRDIKSYNISTNRKTPKNTYLDKIILCNTDTKQVAVFDQVQTVANYPSTDANDNPVNSCYNDTIASGDFEFKLYTTTNVAEGMAGVITNTKTIDGKQVNSDGITENGLSPGRGLGHSNVKPDGTGKEYQTPYSKQCFIMPGKDNKRFFQTLKDWGVKSGDSIKGKLIDMFFD